MSTHTELESRIPEIVAELPVKLDKVAEAGAELISVTAKEKSPYDSHKSKSEPHLRDAIHTEKVEQGVHAVAAGDEEVFWGIFVENGTSHSAPEPFLVPALEEDRPEVYALAKAALKVVE